MCTTTRVSAAFYHFSPSRHLFPRQPQVDGRAAPQVSPPAALLKTNHPEQIAGADIVHRRHKAFPAPPPGIGDQQDIPAQQAVKGRAQDCFDEGIPDPNKKFLDG
ncbi:MAG TPA: hypothetical protein VF498_09385, partial [Anaerolineales bacterium]